MNTINLVFLPGLLNDARLFQQQVDGLSDIAHCTVADLSKANSISALASLVLTHAPEGLFALAGLSMGGYVALEIMRQAPERILGLALLDTSARPDSPEATEGRHKAMLLAETDFAQVLNDLLPKMVLPAHQQAPAIGGLFLTMGESQGKEVFMDQQMAIIGRKDSRSYLSHIACPTLVLCGRDDIITPLEVHQEMADAIPHTSLVVIDNAGHLSALDQPAQVTKALRGWLQSLQA